MHFTDPVYRNPYWPTWPLIQITQSCTHNKCKFCTMYKGVPFRMQPMDWLEQDLQELQTEDPHAKTIQLLSANPLALSSDCLMPRLELIRKYLPELEHMYTATRVSDIKNKTVEQLRKLKDIGVNEISLGVESGDDWTLKRILSATIYTMNCPNEDIYRQMNYHILMDYAARQLGVFGPTEILCSYDTYQFPNYDRYDAATFDEAHKAEVRDTQFPQDLKRAYELGKRLVVSV